MIIENKDWLYNQTLRLSLSGLSQEQIARELHVSEGTVNSIMQELMNSDDTLPLKHEIAVVSKKSGIPIKQLASNLAFTNAIKFRGFEANKIESLLRAIDSFCVQEGSYDPDTIGQLFIQFCGLIMKNQISPDSLNKQLEAKYDEHYKLVQQVQREKANLSQIQEKSKSELERNNVTRKTLRDFLNLKEDFEQSGLDFDKREEILNVLFNVSVMDKDPKKIIDEMKKIRLLNLHRVELLTECERVEKTLEFFKREEVKAKIKMNLYPASVEVINKILQKGNSPESILKIFDIYSKHLDLSLEQFASDIDTYGGFQGAISKKFLDYIRTNLSTQDLNPYRTNITNSPYSDDITQYQQRQ